MMSASQSWERADDQCHIMMTSPGTNGVQRKNMVCLDTMTTVTPCHNQTVIIFEEQIRNKARQHEVHSILFIDVPPPTMETSRTMRRYPSMSTLHCLLVLLLRLGGVTLLGWTPLTILPTTITTVQAFSPPPLLLKTLGEFLKAGKEERRQSQGSPFFQPQTPTPQPTTSSNIGHSRSTTTGTTTTTTTTTTTSTPTLSTNAPAYDPLNPPLKIIRPGDQLWIPGCLGNDYL
jgi:hypothetical protein